MGAGGKRGGGSRSSGSSGSSGISSSFGRSSHTHSYSSWGSSSAPGMGMTGSDGSRTCSLFDIIGEPSFSCACFKAIYLCLLVIVGAFLSFVPYTLSMDVGETRTFAGSLAPLYVSQYEIHDMSKKIDIFWTDEITLETVPADQPVMHTESVVIKSDEYLDFSYWLNTGSTIDIKLTARGESNIDFYIFKGDAFDKFVQAWSSQSSSWHLYTTYLQSGNDRESQTTFTIEDSDTYYLAFFNSYHDKAIVDFSFMIRKTHYQFDESLVKPICGPGALLDDAKGLSTCKINVDMFDTRKILLRSPPLAKSSDSHSGPRQTILTTTDPLITPAGNLGKKTNGDTQSEITYDLEIYWSVRILGYTYLFAEILFCTLAIAYALSWYTGRNWGSFFKRNDAAAYMELPTGPGSDGYARIEGISDTVESFGGIELGNAISTAVAVEMPMAEVVSERHDDFMPISIHGIVPSAPPKESF